MRFKPGQEVVCVIASKHLVKDNIYTIISQSPKNSKAVLVVEAIAIYPEMGFWEWRFEPVMDLGEIKEILKQEIINA